MHLLPSFRPFQPPKPASRLGSSNLRVLVLGSVILSSQNLKMGANRARTHAYCKCQIYLSENVNITINIKYGKNT